MRIINGLLKKHRFNPPKGFPSRPTTDFAKEGLFNLLENEMDLYDLEILDLFAGTGNITFEFASREAGDIIAVDRNIKCVQFIKKFAHQFKLHESITIIKADAIKFAENSHLTFDLIFADPPFDFENYPQLISIILEKDLLMQDGIFVLEHSKRHDFSSHSHCFKTRNYGQITFSFFQKEIVEP